jgi:50S ribosomal subunit-associated GTPase HflX
VTPEGVLERAKGLYPGHLRVSALTGEGLDDLRSAVAEAVRVYSRGETLVVPYAKWPDFVTRRRRFSVIREVYGDDAVTVTLRGRGAEIDSLRDALGL